MRDKFSYLIRSITCLNSYCAVADQKITNLTLADSSILIHIMETYIHYIHYGNLKPKKQQMHGYRSIPPPPPQLCISDLTEVLSVFSGVDGFGHGCFGAGFAFNLLLVHLSVLDLLVAQDSLAGAETESAELGGVPTHIAGLLAGLLRHLVSRCEMCRETAFASLMPIFFRVGVLQREKDPDPAVERSLF